MIEPDSPSLVTVHLYGALAEQFGPEHRFAIQTPREALWALDANYPGFIREFVKQERYIVIGDDDVRDPETAAILHVAREVHFIPQIEGQAFIFTALVTAIFPGLGAFATQLIGTLLFAGVAIGLSLLIKPKQPEAAKTEEAAKDESFGFAGPENTTKQGVAVPLIYGRVFAGSVVVSAGLDVGDVPIT
jgi:predicted phage tail protein